MKKEYYYTLTILVGIIISFFVYTNINLPSFLEVLKKILSFKLIPYLIITFLIHVVLVWKWKIILKSQNIIIPLRTLFGYKLSGFAISYITPSAHIGGEPLRAMLLKRHGVEFSKGLSTVVIDKSIEITFNAFFGLIGFIILFFNYALPTKAIFVIYTLVITSIFFALFFYNMFTGKRFITFIFRLIRINNVKWIRYEKKVREFESNLINFFKYNRKVFYKVVMIPFIAWVLMLIEYWLLLSMIGIEDISFVKIFLTVVAVAIAYVVPLPAALGVLETTQIAVFKAMNLNTSSAVVLSFVVRIKDILWTLVGLSFLSYYGIKIKKALNDKNGQSL